MRPFRKFQHWIFALFLLGGIFGLFFMVLLYLHYKKPDAAPIAAAGYVIPSLFSENAPNTLYYNFEKNLPAQAAVSAIAHSGKSSLAFPSGKNKSVINIPLGNWSEAQLKEILVRGYMFQNAGARPEAASLVMLISNPMNDVLFSKKIPLKDHPLQKWFEFSVTLSPTDYQYSSDDRLCIYVINQSGTDVLMDDVEVQFAGDLMFAGSFKARQSSTLNDTALVSIEPARLLTQLMRDISLTSADSLLSLQTAELLADDAEVVCGNFTFHTSSSSQLLLRNSKGFILCTADEKGKAIRLNRIECSAADSIRDDVFPACGDFDGDGFEELLYASFDAGKLYLLKPLMQKDIVMMQTRKIVSGLTDCSNILALQNAGGNALPLCIAPNGSYTIIKSLSKGAMTTSAPMLGPSCWNQKFFSTSFVALQPSGNSRSARLLCAYKKTTANDQGMILYGTDENNSGLHMLKTASSEPLPQYDQSLLKPTDHVFSFSGKGERPQFLRDRNDFRYDVQLIRLEGDDRWMCTPLDFARQAGEDNPKYNPVCRVIPLADSPRGLLCLVITRAGDHERPVISLYIAGNAESGGISNPNL
jgi:hypothetical protein